MMPLKQLLTRPLAKVPNSIVIFALIVAILGFADATYLTIEHYQDVIPPCSITGGCEKVLTSPFASVAGIPVSLLGALYYLVISIGFFIYLDTKNTLILKRTFIFSILGFLASLWFLFLQAFIIHAYCVYCLGSAVTSTVLFVITLIVLNKYKPVETLLL